MAQSIFIRLGEGKVTTILRRWSSKGLGIPEVKISSVPVPAFANNKMASSNWEGDQRANRPEPAQITRDRSSKKNNTKYKTRGLLTWKKVPLHDRINQFPDQHLSVRDHTILCTACREVVSSEISILLSHWASKTYTSGKEKIKKSKLREQTITDALSLEKSRQDSTHPSSYIVHFDTLSKSPRFLSGMRCSS